MVTHRVLLGIPDLIDGPPLHIDNASVDNWAWILDDFLLLPCHRVVLQPSA